MRLVTRGLFVKEKISDSNIIETETETAGVLTWGYEAGKGTAGMSGSVQDCLYWKVFRLTADGNGRIEYGNEWYDASMRQTMLDRIVERVARGDFMGDNSLSGADWGDTP